MAVLFNEKNLKDALRNMTGTNRENYVNTFIDMAGMPASCKTGNSNLDTAYQNMGTAITCIYGHPEKSHIPANIQNHLNQLIPKIWN